jgi:hypothetical protein
MRKVLTILLLLLLGNAGAFAQASSSSVFKDRDNPISASDLQSKVVVKGPKPVAGDIISGVIRDADGPFILPVVERDSLNRTLAYSFTDSTGYFSFRLVNPDDRLQVIYIGYYSVNCEFSGCNFEIEMKPDIDGRIIIENWPGWPGPVIPRDGDTFPLLLHNGKLASFPEGSRDKLNSFDFDRYYNNLDKIALLYGINRSDIKEVKVIKDTEAVTEWFAWGINGALDVITR